MVSSATRRRLRTVLSTATVILGLAALTACEPPNKQPEPIGGPYYEKLSGSWSPRDAAAPCKTQKVPLLVASFEYDMSLFCSISVTLF